MPELLPQATGSCVDVGNRGDAFGTKRVVCVQPSKCESMASAYSVGDEKGVGKNTYPV